MSRNAPSDRVAIRSKVAAKYDKTAETEVITWFEKLIDVKLESGTHKLEKQLRNGQHLVKLVQKIQSDTPNCPEKAKNMVLKLNTDMKPFKQMENIQTFLAFCEHYGVQKTGLFHPKDLFEGRNLSQVLSCIQQLGSECQRNNFSGPCIGPKPLEKNIRDFSEEKLRAGLAIIGMQAGSHKGASQSGMHTGPRNIVDSRTEVNKDGTANKCSNKGDHEVVNGDEHNSKLKKPEILPKPNMVKNNEDDEEDEEEEREIEEVSGDGEDKKEEQEEKETTQQEESKKSEEEIDLKETKKFVYDTSKPADEKIKERSWRKK